MVGHAHRRHSDPLARIRHLRRHGRPGQPVVGGQRAHRARTCERRALDRGRLAAGRQRDRLGHLPGGRRAAADRGLRRLSRLRPGSRALERRFVAAAGRRPGRPRAHALAASRRHAGGRRRVPELGQHTRVAHRALGRRGLAAVRPRCRRPRARPRRAAGRRPRRGRRLRQGRHGPAAAEPRRPLGRHGLAAVRRRPDGRPRDVGARAARAPRRRSARRRRLPPGRRQPRERRRALGRRGVGGGRRRRRRHGPGPGADVRRRGRGGRQLLGGRRPPRRTLRATAHGLPGARSRLRRGLRRQCRAAHPRAGGPAVDRFDAGRDLLRRAGDRHRTRRVWTAADRDPARRPAPGGRAGVPVADGARRGGSAPAPSLRRSGWRTIRRSSVCGCTSRCSSARSTRPSC